MRLQTFRVWDEGTVRKTRADLYKVGEIKRDPGFLSTSLSEETAVKTFADETGGAVWRVRVPGQTPAIDMTDLSRYADEYEVLFPRETALRITKIGRDPYGRLHIDADLIDAPIDTPLARSHRGSTMDRQRIRQLQAEPPDLGFGRKLIHTAADAPVPHFDESGLPMTVSDLEARAARENGGVAVPYPAI